MEESVKLILNSSFICFLLIIIYFYYNNLIKDNVDKLASILAIIISLIQLVSKNIKILDISHFLFNIVYMFLVTFFSKNKYFLALNIIMLIITLITRYIYKICILNVKQNHKGFFASINNKLKKYVKIWDFDYIFPLLLIINIYRFIKI